MKGRDVIADRYSSGLAVLQQAKRVRRVGVLSGLLGTRGYHDQGR